MDEQLPDLQMDIITITLDRDTGRVEVDYQGMNYLEAIGCLTVALTQVQEIPFEMDFEDWSDDESDDF